MAPTLVTRLPLCLGNGAERDQAPQQKCPPERSSYHGRADRNALPFWYQNALEHPILLHPKRANVHHCRKQLCMCMRSGSQNAVE